MADDELDETFAQQAVVRVVNGSPLYDDDELKAFVAARVSGTLDTAPEARSLMPPSDLVAKYSLGVVHLSWEAGSLNRMLSSTLASQGSDLRLAFRIYRGLDLQPPELVATVPFGAASWRDGQLPLGRTRLLYEVWAVLLRSSDSGDVLVGAERSETVTVASPEHFTLSLVGGGPEHAVFDVQVDLPAAAGRATITVQRGQPVQVANRPTGLILQSIMQSTEEKLTAQRHLLLTSDGSLVLDPTTNQPRTTQTQVLLPVTRLTATLLAQDGELRTLVKDLP